MLEFLKIRTNPEISQKQITKEMGFSNWKIERYGIEINMNNPYNRSNIKRKRAPKDVCKRKGGGWQCFSGKDLFSLAFTNHWLTEYINNRK